jgi:hypothetical protein
MIARPPSRAGELRGTLFPKRSLSIPRTDDLFAKETHLNIEYSKGTSCRPARGNKFISTQTTTSQAFVHLLLLLHPLPISKARIPVAPPRASTSPFSWASLENLDAVQSVDRHETALRHPVRTIWRTDPDREVESGVIQRHS